MHQMPGSEDSGSRAAHVMVPHRWRSARILEAVWQVNEHLVSALSDLARLGSVSTVIVRQNSECLRRLDAAGCKRAARIPVLLLDLHFQSADWWRIAAGLNGGGYPAASSDSSLPADLAAELTRETLIVSWLAVRDTPQSANLLIGMSDAVASLLGELTVQQIDRVAVRKSQELRIRWQSNPEFWQRLLAAGQSGSAEELCETHLFGLQLLGGELISGSS
jgi:hypothetical protein